MPEPGGDNMYGNARQQQGCGMDVAKIVQPGVWMRIVRLLAACGSL